MSSERCGTRSVGGEGPGGGGRQEVTIEYTTGIMKTRTKGAGMIAGERT